jgi:hypothetical protein
VQDEQQRGDDAQHGEGLRRIGGETVEHGMLPFMLRGTRGSGTPLLAEVVSSKNGTIADALFAKIHLQARLPGAGRRPATPLPLDGHIA